MFISEIPDVTFAVFCLLVLSSADCKHHCHHRITAHSDKIISFTDQNFNTGGKEQEYCVLEIKSRPHHLINVNLNYRPRLATAVVNCSTDYLRVGNDNSRIDHELMTSYKFCEELTQENIISRDNYLWIVLRTSNKSATFKIEARSQPKVRCKTDEFECSPIQCVSMDVLCDGIADCHNNRDEFCQKNFANNSCFHCFDGTCIRPVLPRYSEDWGKEMWYLCDEIQHCPDGTDERKGNVLFIDDDYVIKIYIMGD
ncbi:hypothetical protein SNE40_017876 [Patella caerulea]|uniref:CUB domain-containing protein n=1 Tax=Patella caerulea TaxID=87958 RepID=A0AAN8JEM9_PATCE